MGFVRQTINNASSFNTGGELENISNPQFSIWTNISDQTGFSWDLGLGWTVRIDSSTKSLTYNYNKTPRVTFTTAGYEPLTSSLSLTNLGSLPDPTAYTDGTVIRSGGALYVAVTE
tara:strand:- start:19940 stop:20287 length:348 start_codon:yes stop_codon:yes gene_type:complete